MNNPNDGDRSSAWLGHGIEFMETKYKRQSIGRDKAIALANSGWWEGKTPREIARFQLFTDELSLPCGVFHGALEKTLGRPVWTHELVLNYDGLAMELIGENMRLK